VVCHRYTYWATWKPSMHPDLTAPAGEELYDHTLDTTRYNVDDFEYTNLAADPKFASVLAQLRGNLVARVASWQRTDISAQGDLMEPE
jgi:hypothetical protein